jgi:hypothetical protein
MSLLRFQVSMLSLATALDAPVPAAWEPYRVALGEAEGLKDCLDSD